MLNIKGSCHCKNIQYELLWPEDDQQIPVRACSCTFCTKFNGRYTSHPDASLNINISDRSKINRYNFGTKTADFIICTQCGIVVCACCEIDDCLYAVVNVNTFIDFDLNDADQSITNFDSESTTQRLQRRKQKWIKHVEIRYLN